VTLLLEQHPLVIIVFLAFGLLTAISNCFVVRRFDQYPRPSRWPRLSVLVPARNEGQNIEMCVTSLLAQDYPDFEVIVLDDHSTDATRSILSRLQRLDPALRVLDGAPLPAGWPGKHWACHQLAAASEGELLLFTDADTRHAPDVLRDSVSAMLAERADLVTAFPREQVPTWGERLVIPFISFGIFSFLPVALVYRLRWANLSVSIGQFMLFRRAALESIGGYAAVRESVTDDVALGRLIIANGLEWRLLDATRHVTCRMYRGFWDAVEGFTKNVFAFFDYHVLLYLLIWSWVAVAFIEPPLVIFIHAVGLPLDFFPYRLALIATAESLALWGIAYRRFQFPAYLVFLYPLSLSIFALIAVRSLVFTLMGQASWKDRAISPPEFRW
jgi:chlorobactene glucosyltransferase